MRLLRKWLPPLTIGLLASLFVLLWETPPEQLLPAALFGDTAARDSATQAIATNILIGSEHRSYDDNGELESFLQAKSSRFYQLNLKHRSANDYTELEAPEFVIYRERGLPWRVSARLAHSRDNAEQVDLFGDVRLWQATDAPQKPELLTSHLVVRPKQQYAETDKPVTIRSPNEITQAIGMKADLEQEKFELLSDVRGVYEPAR